MRHMRKMEAFACGLALATAVDTTVLAFDAIGQKAKAAVTCDFVAAAGATGNLPPECDKSTFDFVADDLQNNALDYLGIEVTIATLVGGGLRFATRGRGISYYTGGQ